MANALTTITGSAIGADAVTGAKVADDAIDSEHYTNASIDHAHLANDCVDGDNLADDAVNSEHYVDASIDHQHLANDCVDGDNIADDAVNSEHYVDASIDHQHLADDCVDADNIADNSVGLAAMAHGTDGNIITFDANGAPAYVATGNSGQILTSNGSGAAPTFQTASGGGIEHIYTWNNAGFSMSAGDQYMTANWSDTNANESSDYSALGSGMSESSGVFTFPATGHWLVQWRVLVYVQNTYSRWSQLRIYTTTNNSSYSQRTTTGNNQWNADGIGNGVVYDSLKTEMIFDVTNTTNCKVKFWISVGSTTQVSGSYGSLAHFVKLADT